MIFYASMYTEGLIRDAIISKICLGKMIESLETVIKDVSDEPSRSEDVFRVYELFFHILQRELEERKIEKVEIGMVLDVTGCEIDHTLEMTSNGFFICSKGEREECTMQDVLEDMYQPEHVIGRVTGAITRQHNKLLIEDLKSGIKYIGDLVANENKIYKNSGPFCYVNETNNNGTDVDYNPATQEEADISTLASSSDGKEVNESEAFDKGT